MQVVQSIHNSSLLCKDVHTLSFLVHYPGKLCKLPPIDRKEQKTSNFPQSSHNICGTKLYSTLTIPSMQTSHHSYENRLKRYKPNKKKTFCFIVNLHKFGGEKKTISHLIVRFVDNYSSVVYIYPLTLTLIWFC